MSVAKIAFVRDPLTLTVGVFGETSCVMGEQLAPADRRALLIKEMEGMVALGVHWTLAALERDVKSGERQLVLDEHSSLAVYTRGANLSDRCTEDPLAEIFSVWRLADSKTPFAFAESDENRLVAFSTAQTCANHILLNDKRQIEHITRFSYKHGADHSVSQETMTHVYNQTLFRAKKSAL